MNKLYNGITELAKHIVGDEFAKNLEEETKNTQISKILVGLRNREKINLGEMSTRIGCTKQKLIEFESLYDREYKIGDLLDYCDKIGYRYDITFEPKKPKEIKNICSSCNMINCKIQQDYGILAIECNEYMED